jgi:hypothetical protein
VERMAGMLWGNCRIKMDSAFGSTASIPTLSWMCSHVCRGMWVGCWVGNCCGTCGDGKQGKQDGVKDAVSM